MGRIKKIINILSEASSSAIISEGIIEKGNDCVIENSDIRIGKKAKLIIGNNVSIRNYKIRIEEGVLSIGDRTILERANNALVPLIDISKGTLKIGSFNVVRADFCLRFSSNCVIGQYNCINENTEIRCDESLTIGDFNMISYECMIYDTNSHVIYTPEKRREMTKRDFPYIGREYEKPVTSPVIIGNDCWLGKRAVILKGTKVGNNSIIASCCVVTGEVPENNIAYGNPAQLKSKRK